MLTSSWIPLRPSGLALLLEEREKKKVLSAYLGDLEWNTVAALHSFFGDNIKIPSYSDMISKLTPDYQKQATKEPEDSNTKVIQHVMDMLNRFAPKGGEKI